MHRALWIEDDASELRSLVSGLCRAGWHVAEVTTENEAHSLLERDSEWDVIILDVILPERENPVSLAAVLRAAERRFIGLDVLQHINTYYGGRRPPVIALTKVGDDDVQQRLADLGVTDVLTKGTLTPQTVAEAVIRATSAPPSADPLGQEDAHP